MGGEGDRVKIRKIYENHNTMMPALVVQCTEIVVVLILASFEIFKDMRDHTQQPLFATHGNVLRFYAPN